MKMLLAALLSCVVATSPLPALAFDPATGLGELNRMRHSNAAREGFVYQPNKVEDTLAMFARPAR